MQWEFSSAILFHLSKLWKAKFLCRVTYYYWWGCRRNLKLIILRVKGFRLKRGWQRNCYPLSFITRSRDGALMDYAPSIGMHETGIEWMGAHSGACGFAIERKETLMRSHPSFITRVIAYFFSSCTRSFTWNGSIRKLQCPGLASKLCLNLSPKTQPRNENIEKKRLHENKTSHFQPQNGRKSSLQSRVVWHQNTIAEKI